MDTSEIQEYPAASEQKFSFPAGLLRGHGGQYAWTFATELSVLACQLITYRLAAHLLGASAFSEYALARRTVSLLYPIPLLGLGVALPRFIAHESAKRPGAGGKRYFGAAVWCVALGLLVCLSSMNLLPRTYAYLFFGSSEYAALIMPLSLWLLGLCLHSLVYAYHRGRLELNRANLLQMINLGLIPVIAFLAFHRALPVVLQTIGVANTAVALLALSFSPVRFAGSNVSSEAKELLRYGIQRVPGDFFQMALLALPATLVAHVQGVREAGYVAFGISVLNMIASLFSPVGLVLLPLASRMLAQGADDQIRRHIVLLLQATLIISVAIALLATGFAPSLITWYLGSSFSSLAGVVRLMAWGAVPFCVFYVLRGLVDAFHSNGINTKNLAITLATFCALAGMVVPLGLNVTSIVLCLTAALLCLGFLTLNEARRILNFPNLFFAFSSPS